jgi:phage shock protein A
VPKQNYHQARKQKEQARKARQQEKQQRRVTRVSPSGDNVEASAAELPVPLADNSTS